MAFANIKDTINQAGDVILEKCEIVSYRLAENNKPRTVDVTKICGSIELTENIFDVCMVGKLQLYDSQDIRTVLPITGLDKLNLKFQTPGMKGVDFTEDSGKQFHVYKVERIQQDPTAQRAQGYDVFFTSKEYYYNFMHRVSKAYEGPLELAIEDILRNPKYLNSNRALFYEPTRSNAKYVIPNLRPFAAIKFLCEQSISGKYQNAGYVFYESPSGYFFRSLESMYGVSGSAGRPTKFDYYYQVQNVHKDVNWDMHSVLDYRFSRPVNVLHNMDNGMFGNRLITHDAFNKTINTHDFDYYKTFGEYYHVDNIKGAKSFVKQSIPFMKFDDTDKDISQFPDARVSVVSETSKVHDKYEFVPSKDTLPINISQKQQLANSLLSLVVPGNSLLGAGDVISFDLPLMRPVGDGEKQQSSPWYSGRYLVTAIKHTISTEVGKYQQTLKCSKDSVKEGMVPETTPYQANKENPITYDIYEEDNRVQGVVDYKTDIDFMM